MRRRLTRWVLSRYFYPGNDGTPRRRDPRHGQIDRDIQWKVHYEIKPRTLGSRVVWEDALQKVKGYGGRGA